MSPTDIRKHLLDLRVSEAEIARQIGKSRQMVSKTICGKCRTPWVRRAIATTLGMTYARVWGEDDPGTPAGTKVNSKSTALGCRVNQTSDGSVSVGGTPCAA